MKIIRIAQFEDEGRDPLEQIEERDLFEQMQERTFQEGPFHTSNIIDDITPSFVERLDSNYTAEGAEGLFEYKDGKVYKITITPARKNESKITPYDPNDDIRM